MTGIIHLNELDRVQPRVSRRKMIAGGAGAALMAAFGGNAVAQIPDASPDATPDVTRGGTHMADARDRLRSLLTRLPADVIANRRDAVDLFSWIDLEMHFSAHGVSDPFATSTDIVALTTPLVSSDPLFQYAMAPEVTEMLGFSVFNVHQTLSAGLPPERVTMYAGGVTFADLGTTWEAAGYERRTAEWGDYWTLGENGEADLSLGAPLGIGTMNNVALLADDIVVFAQTLDLLSSVMELDTGEGEAAADDEGIARLVETMPGDTVNAMAFSGEAFHAEGLVPENPGMESVRTVEDLLADSDAAVGPMPRLFVGLSGVTAGAMAPGMSQDGGTPSPQGNADAIAFISFVTASAEAAAEAAEVAYWRLENMQSFTTGEVYSERFVPITPVEEAVEGEVMTVRFGPDIAGRGALNFMVLSRDVWPFAWLDEA